MSKSVSISPDQEWETRQDLDALKRAYEVRKDPKRMSALSKLLGKEEKALGAARTMLKVPGMGKMRKMIKGK